MKDVRTVIWDCDNLIWFHLKEEPEIVARSLGIQEVPEFLAEYHDFFSNFVKHFRNKKVTIKETYRFIEERIPILYFYNYRPEQFMKVLDRLKFLCSDFNEEALELIKYFSDKGIRNIVKSDWFRDIQQDMLNVYGLLDYIEELHCCDNAYLKCNPLSAEGIVKSGKEENYVIIGDSLTSDIAFASHTGIKSIWFNRNGQNKNDTQYQPTFEITSLLEVMEII